MWVKAQSHHLAAHTKQQGCPEVQCVQSTKSNEEDLDMESTTSLISNLRAYLSVNGVVFVKVPQKLQQVCVPIWKFGYIVACQGRTEKVTSDLWRVTGFSDP